MRSTVAKIWALLTWAQRREAILLFVMMLIGMCFETIGVGLVFPLITMLGNPGRIGTSLSFLPRPLLDSMLLGTHERLIVIALIGLVAVYVVKNSFLAVLVWRQAKFAFALQADLSQRLFALYLSQPYAFHLQRNSAQLIRNATAEVNAVTFNVVLPGLYLCSETFVVAGLAALLVWIEPLGAIISLSVLAVAGWLFQRATSERIQRGGESRQYHEGKRIQHLQQSLGGVKEVKLLGREAEFLAKYRHHAEHYSHAGRSHVTLQQVPRLWIEILAVTGLALIVLSMIGQGRQIAAVLPILALFAAAAFRLLPSVSRTLTYLQNIRFARPVVDVLHQEFSSLPRPLDRSDRLQPMQPFAATLELQQLTYRYEFSEHDAVREVSLTVRAGEAVGFIGGSGSGKSTLIDLLLGLLDPTRGSVVVDGRDIRDGLKSWQGQIGYVPQSIFLTDDSIKRNVAFGLPDAAISESEVWRALRAAQLEDFVKSMRAGMETIVGERGVRLSGGQRQRVGLARALYHDPSVLVLDEATSSLDKETESGVMEAIGALRGIKTMVIVAHRLDTLEQCDRIYRFEHGQIFWTGTYDQLLSQKERIEPLSCG